MITSRPTLQEFPKTIFAVTFDMFRGRPIPEATRAQAALEISVMRWFVFAASALAGLALWLAYLGWEPTPLQLIEGLATLPMLGLMGLAVRTLLRMSSLRQALTSLSFKVALVNAALVVLLVAHLIGGPQVFHPTPGLVTVDMITGVLGEVAVMVCAVEIVAARLRALRP